MKKILIIASCIIILGTGLYARGDTATPNSFYYVFHLFQNSTGQLVTDRDFKFSYDIIPGAFVQSAVGQFPYRGEVINLEGQVTAQFKFNVQSGKISVQAPYVADAQKVVFYDNQNQPVLTIPVSASSFCNDNGICNADRGENYQTCPKDCSQSLPAPPVASTTPTPSTGGSSGLLSSILYLLGGLILAGAGWWFFKRRGSGSISLPPSLPTPPAPGNIQ